MEEVATNQRIQVTSRAEKVKETDSFLEPPEGMKPYRHLDLAMQDLYQTSDLRNYMVINVCCWKLLNEGHLIQQR